MNATARRVVRGSVWVLIVAPAVWVAGWFAIAWNQDQIIRYHQWKAARR